MVMRLYEDMIAGRISEQNFNTMLEKTQTEQTELKTKVSEGRKRLSDEVQLANDAKQWVEAMQEYANITELDAATLNRLIKEIVVHQMSEILLYHGSKEEVVYPEIRITRYTKDFSWGFYCTNSYQQAYRWADRRSADGIVNVYRYVENPDLKILRFPEMSDEWLDFIAKCRAGETHPYDIVEDPMADDTIWDYVNGFTSGQISREASSTRYFTVGLTRRIECHRFFMATAENHCNVFCVTNWSSE